MHSTTALIRSRLSKSKYTPHAIRMVLHSSVTVDEACDLVCKVEECSREITECRKNIRICDLPESKLPDLEEKRLQFIRAMNGVFKVQNEELKYLVDRIRQDVEDCQDYLVVEKQPFRTAREA